MFGLGLFPLILVAGGLYFVMRKSDAPAAGGGGGVTPALPAKDLLTADGLAKRFEADLAAFKAAEPSFKDESEARKSFLGGDDRPRALAMMEFTATSFIGNPLSEIPLSEAARKAALSLAVDYRDQFEFLSKKGELAQKLMDETAALLKVFVAAKAADDPKVASDPKVYAGVDRASVALIVDTPFVAQVATSVIAGPDSVMMANIFDTKSGAAIGTAQVSLSSDYHMQSGTQTLASGVTIDAYIGRIVEGSVTGGDGKVFDLKGLYPVAYAPRAGGMV